MEGQPLKVVAEPPVTVPYSSAVFLILCSPLQTISFGPDSVQDCGFIGNMTGKAEEKLRIEQLKFEGDKVLTHG